MAAGEGASAQRVRNEVCSETGKRNRIPREVLCAVALTLAFAQYWLLNFTVFPAFDTTFIWTREASAVVGGMTFAVLACIAYWRPRAVSLQVFSWGTAGVMVAGMACALVSVAAQSPVLVVVGVSLVTVGSGLANVVVGLGCIGLGARTLGIVLAWAYLASFALRWVFDALPPEANMALFTVFPLIASACVFGSVREVVGVVRASDSPAHFAVTTPGSFIPFASQVFISLVVFRFIYGYSLTFGEVDRVPIVNEWALVPLIVLLVWVLASSRPCSPDGLYRAAILLSIGGFLMVSTATDGRGVIANALLSSGTGLFDILMFLVLISLGSKNPAGALPALAWGNAMASWGTILGAVSGRVTNAASAGDPHMLSVICAVIVFALTAYVVLVLHRFSFTKTIANVVRVEPTVAQMPVEQVDAAAVRSSELAAEYGLTEREREVFNLLAHGRNARFIQNELTVSYNTVKTHVSHIYAKLGVHTQQELIDMVEMK